MSSNVQPGSRQAAANKENMSILTNGFSSIQHAYAVLFLELPARVMGINRLIRQLEKFPLTFEKKAAVIKGRPGNIEILAHIIGIERWGQRRLRVALGEPLILEEYDFYRPDEKDWQRLLDTFHNVRQETISLSKSLRMAGVDPMMRIMHNQFGEINLLCWLFYLDVHAFLESARIN